MDLGWALEGCSEASSHERWHASVHRIASRAARRSATTCALPRNALEQSQANTQRAQPCALAQVEIAVGAFLGIVLLFLIIAIFADATAVRSTWTALSAGLLSFTFIVGNALKDLFENTVRLGRRQLQAVWGPSRVGPQSSTG